MNAFILAGGKSTRMGRDKALLEWQGRPLIEHAVTRLRALGMNAQILGSRPDLACFAPVVPDNFPGQGPLAGIEAALSVTDTGLNLFVPIDLPMLPAEFLRWMSVRAETTQAAATIPCIEGRPQPLCAIYHRGLCEGIRASLQRGDGKVTRAIELAAQATGMRQAISTHIDLFDVEAVAATDVFTPVQHQVLPPHLWFENVNAPDDLARSLHRWPA